MARKYFFTFKTFQNHTCRVDINDATYSGTAIELTKNNLNSPGCPADEPVVIEEDNSDNLFDVVRTKTGYLNLIEFQEGSLDDLHPQRNNDLEVYVLMDAPSSMMPTDNGADDYIIFHGYIQAQSFDNTLYGYRNEKKIPIQSVMGTFGSKEINTDHIGDILSILYYSMPQYKYIVMPYITYETPDEDHEGIILMKITPNILAPVNSDYNYGVPNEEDAEPESPLSPLTNEEFVEKFCKAFGFISHDVGNMLVFTKIGYTGDYIRYPNGADDGTIIGNGGTINTLLLNFDRASNKDKYSYVDSLKSVVMKWEDLHLPQSVDFSVAKFITGASIYGTILAYKGVAISSNRWYTSPTGDINNSTFIAGDGEKEMIVAAGGTYQQEFFSCVIPHIGPMGNIHIEGGGGSGIAVMTEDSNYFYNFNYNPDDPDDEYWVDHWVMGTFLTSNGVADIPIVSGYPSHWEARPTKIRLFFYSLGSTTKLIASKIELQKTANEQKYLYPQAAIPQETVHLDPASEISEELDIDFHAYKIGYIQKPTFEYMGVSQRNIEISLRKKTNIKELDLLIGKFAISPQDSLNRIISSRHNVREDIYKFQIMGNQYF